MFFRVNNTSLSKERLVLFLVAGARFELATFGL